MIQIDINIEKQGEQSSTWSKEDEERFESCIKVLQTSDGYDTINVKWLKSLKDRVGCASHFTTTKQWSKEDRRIFDNINLYIRKAGDYPHFNKENIKEAINWLESLKDRYTWKPSEEQMEYLAKAITTLGDEGDCKTALILII